MAGRNRDELFHNKITKEYKNLIADGEKPYTAHQILANKYYISMKAIQWHIYERNKSK